jgi:purine-binding chemotaxis protein CheW
VTSVRESRRKAMMAPTREDEMTGRQTQGSTVEGGAETAQYFTFFLRDTLYGIEIESVREIIEYEKAFSVPCVPDYVKGVINVRGEIIPIIDLSQRLFSRGTELSRFTAIAVIDARDGNGTSPVGIMVDRVNRVREIISGNITAPEVGYKIRPDFLKGIAADGDNFVVLLNENHLLNINDMSEEIAGTGKISAELSYTMLPALAGQQ